MLQRKVRAFRAVVPWEVVAAALWKRNAGR
jgi:hypothetical protein